MPGIPPQHQTSRASGTSGIYVSTYTSIHALPSYVWNALEKHERPSNVILPHALNTSRRHQEMITPNQFWMTCETTRSPASSSSERQLDFILSCTEWHMGTYPIFIVSTHPTHTLTSAFLAPRVALLATELQVTAVPNDRVYSIFAPAPLSKAFAQAWATVSGVELEEHSYYAARFSHCTRRTFVDRPLQPANNDGSIYNLRLAREEDISQVAALCKGFASKSEPFFLDDAGALKEAKYLIENRIGWVHEVVKNGVSEIACLVATTRNSSRVATITKVYTSPSWRKRGCAERLVRAVCQ
ncbi:hypothetical protein Clacol_007487 [Clathrus columnatus]|uniref:N-acetyltransferase domain-containing protein n=1 Tax=Clathrus columnatus TaxID=1419009 RepID=A0AAV5ALC0_9AGAM|nr:hypothetical protein Clacol_007487 [Clathrus columnatus]